MAKLFSYVVDHDDGFAPNPQGRYCTLVHCKFGGIDGRKNVVELAEVGDWIIGTGGKSKKSCGNGRIIYVMRVDEKIPFNDFLCDSRFNNRDDQVDLGRGNQFALISTTFFYFGKKAISVSGIPSFRLRHPIEKRGPGFRCDFPESFVDRFAEWMFDNYGLGKHGEPCTSPLNCTKARKKCGKLKLPVLSRKPKPQRGLD